VIWDGDISAMGQLADRARDLARVPALASLEVAKEIAGLIEDEFASGTDPYGHAWQELAESTRARGRHDPPLTDTHAMRDSVNVYARSDGRGVALTIDHPAAPHQTGWDGPQGSGPARPVLPAHGMPATWAEAIKVATDRAIDEVLS
jgi:hypothetical protein